jgi:hypothetical protein
MMKQAVALVKTYVPPNPAMIQRSVDAGKASMEVLQPGKVVRLVFKDYELPGDSLGVTMNATMGSLTDGATYTASTRLSLPSEKLEVNVANSGCRKM